MELKSLKQFVNEAFDKPSKIQMELRKEYEEAIEKLFITETDIDLDLSLLRIKHEKRGKGFATKIMDDLIDYANDTNKIIHLTPSKEFGSDIDRLTNFYKDFDFVLNKGKNRDSRFKSKMIRYPNK
jgi:GNAT superfamily N-acetyltransferase